MSGYNLDSGTYKSMYPIASVCSLCGICVSSNQNLVHHVKQVHHVASVSYECSICSANWFSICCQSLQGMSQEVDRCCLIMAPSSHEHAPSAGQPPLCGVHYEVVVEHFRLSQANSSKGALTIPVNIMLAYHLQLVNIHG